MKNMVKSLIIVLFLSFLFSCQKKSQLEQSLELAGKNRIELEKVLEHYSKDSKDKLKLKAAQYLIENMDTCFSITSPELDAYYKTIDSIFTLNGSENITPTQESLLKQLNMPDLNLVEPVPDLQTVSSDFLIDNIDRAFEAWKSPFAKDMNFDDFCEYLLPYKVNPSDLPDSSWRSTFHDTFYPYVKFGLDTVCHLDSGIVLQYPALTLDGNKFINLPDHIFDTLPEFTVCSWTNQDEYRKWARVFDLGGTTWNCYVCFMPYTPDSLSQFEMKTPTTWNAIQDAHMTIGQRSHIALSYSNIYISFYINGSLKRRMTPPLSYKDLTRNYIGKSHYDNDSLYFKGEIDTFRIYNRELNDAEINALAGKTDLPDKRERLVGVARVINNLYHVNISYDPLILGGYRPIQLIHLKKGSCSNYTALGAYIFRSLGIPSAIDFVPQWGSRSMGHDWNVIYTGKNRMEDFAFGSHQDTIGYDFQTREDKAAKIFRHTFAAQSNSLAMQNDKDRDLPSSFLDPRIKDVTDSYLNCKDISIFFTQQPPKNRKYAYLCNFNNHEWIPVYWGKIEGKKAVFTKMGKDIAYLPVFYDEEGIQPAADPFRLTKAGEIKKLIPDHSKKQSMILTRKYKPGDVPKKGELLMGGRFQVANKPDFSDSLNVYVVKTVPEILYNRVDLTLKKSYRYFRFLSSPNSQGGEISEIEIYTNKSAAKLSGTVIGIKNCPAGWAAENAFDGDPLTSYKCQWYEKGWVGLDFGKPVNITYFRYLPRNDDNFIKEGETYELFYWENYQWNSLGKQTGTSKQYLEYMNMPTNALFWLRNLTKGREERIFTYEKGKQVWW